MSTDLATNLAVAAPTRAVQYALIDVSYEAAVARRAHLDLTDAVRTAWAAGATREQLDTAAGGQVVIADVLDGEPL